MKKKNYFLRKPPENLTFKELFRFIWIQGIGNVLDIHGEPKPWTDTSLETRFFELGYEIDKRSINNWLSGSNKPSAKNLNRLARVVGNDDVGYKRLWRDALTLANTPKEKPNAPPSQTALIKTTPPNKVFQLQRAALVFVGIFFFMVLLSTVVWRAKETPVYVTNLMVCDIARFSKVGKRCTTNVTHFPAGTTLIFASFNLPYATENQLFERKWYRKGQLFSSKKDYTDSAWGNYTWLQNDKGHDHGKYDLRIIVNNEAMTISFYIGLINENHEWP